MATKAGPVLGGVQLPADAVVYDPAREEALCECGATGSGENHCEWCPAAIYNVDADDAENEPE